MTKENEQQGEAPPGLQSQDPDAIGVFKVSEKTTASVNDRGEVTIRQTRKVAVPPPELTAEMVAANPHAKGRVGVRLETVVVKLPAAEFALIGKMVGVVIDR